MCDPHFTTTELKGELGVGGACFVLQILTYFYTPCSPLKIHFDVTQYCTYGNFSKLLGVDTIPVCLVVLTLDKLSKYDLFAYSNQDDDIGSTSVTQLWQNHLKLLFFSFSCYDLLILSLKRTPW